MLVEAQLAVGAEDPTDLVQRGLLVGDGAEDERGDAAIERRIGEGQRVGRRVDDLDWDCRVGCGSARDPAEVRLGLGGHELRHTRSVVGEAQAGAGADLEHSPGEAGEEFLPVGGNAGGVHARRKTREAAREDRVTDAAHGGQGMRGSVPPDAGARPVPDAGILQLPDGT